MLMLNDLDRYRIAMDAIRHTSGLHASHAGLVQHFDEERARHRAFAYLHGIDSPDVTGWGALHLGRTVPGSSSTGPGSEGTTPGGEPIQGIWL